MQQQTRHPPMSPLPERSCNACTSRVRDEKATSLSAGPIDLHVSMGRRDASCNRVNPPTHQPKHPTTNTPANTPTDTLINSTQQPPAADSLRAPLSVRPCQWMLCFGRTSSQHCLRPMFARRLPFPLNIEGIQRDIHF